MYIRYSFYNKERDTALESNHAECFQTKLLIVEYL